MYMFWVLDRSTSHFDEALLSTVNVPKFCAPEFLEKWHGQSVDPDQTAPAGAV